MEMNFGLLIVYMMMAVSIGLAGIVAFWVFRNAKDSQRQSNLMLQAMIKSAQSMRSVEAKLSLVQETGMQSLTFQKKAFDHQRILVLSMNQQLKSIHKMLGAGDTVSRADSSKLPPANGSLRLSKGGLANNFKSQNSNTATTHAGDTKTVVKLEDLFARKVISSPSADRTTEEAVKMPIEQNASLIRRVVNG